MQKQEDIIQTNIAHCIECKYLNLMDKNERQVPYCQYWSKYIDLIPGKGCRVKYEENAWKR